MHGKNVLCVMVLVQKRGSMILRGAAWPAMAIPSLVQLAQQGASVSGFIALPIRPEVMYMQTCASKRETNRVSKREMENSENAEERKGKEEKDKKLPGTTETKSQTKKRKILVT
jgi:hypothetical protein